MDKIYFKSFIDANNIGFLLSLYLLRRFAINNTQRVYKTNTSYNKY